MAKDGGNNDRSVRKIVDWAIQNKDKLDETIFLLGFAKNAPIAPENEKPIGELPLFVKYLWPFLVSKA